MEGTAKTRVLSSIIKDLESLIKQIKNKELINQVLEELYLRNKAEMLKSELEGLNSAIVSKQGEIDWLLAKVAELNSSKRKCEFPNEQNDSGQDQRRKRRKFIHEWEIEPERLAETIIIEDMWREVFAKVDDGLDLLNASRTCQHFNDILDPLKNNFLFGNVFPFLLPHLNLSEVLKCRFVCKDWRSATNSFLEQWSKIGMLDFPLTTSRVHPFGNIIESISKAYSFGKESWSYNCRTVNPFLQQFNSSTRNPFIANSIKILHDNDSDEMYSDEQVEFRKGLDTILDKYGRHIYHFQWSGESELFGSVGLAASEVLRRLFSKAPNLQTLVVEEYYEHLDEVLGFSEIEDITDAVPDLQSLAIETQYENPITNWLFRSFHLQIVKLHLKSPNELDEASNFTWPKVIELTISSESYEGGYLKCFKSFPGLKKICLSIPDLKLSKIIRFTQHLSTICPNFYALQLSHDGFYSLSPCKDEKLYCDPICLAPKELDTLELNLNTPYFSWKQFDFAFLLRFPLIKKLSVVCHPGFDTDRKDDFNKMEIMELAKYLATNSNPRSSNVWRMLPNLETIQLQNKIYKRPKPFAQNVNNSKRQKLEN